ncbi:putative transcriptional regulator [Bacillus sp. TS-2]|nr:putative transcriptional regulator [Bacillus sp. TS-2]
MRKTQRFIEIMMTVSKRRKFTAKELALEFGVSYRTILRDLEELSSMGVPLYSETGADGGYYFLNERMLPPVFLKESEAVLLYFAYESLKYYAALPYETEVDYVLKKMYQNLPQEAKERIDAMKDRIIFWSPHRMQRTTYLEMLLNAAVEQSTLMIHYEGRAGEEKRVIQPVGLYSHNGFWYCPAYCFLRKQFRLFRADRIHSAEPAETPAIFLPYSSVLEWIQLSEATMKNPVPFSVVLSKEGVRRAISDIDLAKMVIVNNEGEGFIETFIPKSEWRFFADLIWNLGNEAFIKEPQEAVTYFKDKLLQLQKYYK